MRERRLQRSKPSLGGRPRPVRRQPRIFEMTVPFRDLPLCFSAANVHGVQDRGGISRIRL